MTPSGAFGIGGCPTWNIAAAFGGSGPWNLSRSAYRGYLRRSADEIEIAGGVVTNGNNSDAIHARGNFPGLDEVSIQTVNGQDMVLTA